MAADSEWGVYRKRSHELGLLTAPNNRSLEPTALAPPL
jgi:hypothetical protein